MGPAHSTITNQHSKRLAVITFNNAELLYKSYNSLYVIEPGETVTVEANPDAIGLKVGIIYQINEETKEFFYQRFLCKNDSIFNVSEIIGEEISFYGDGISLQAKGKLKESDSVAFEMAADAVHDKKSDAPHKLEKEPKKEGAKSVGAAMSDSTKKDMADAAEKKKKAAAAGALTAASTMFKGSAVDTKAVEVKAEPAVEKEKTKKVAKKDDGTASVDGGEVKKKKAVKKKKEGEEGVAAGTTTSAAAKKAGTAAAVGDIDAPIMKPVPKKKKATVDEIEHPKQPEPRQSDVAKLPEKKESAAVDEKFGAGLIPDFSGITNSFQALKEKAKEKLDTAKERIDNAKDFMKEKLTIGTPVKHEEVLVESIPDARDSENDNGDSEPPVPAVNYGFSDFKNSDSGHEQTVDNGDEEADAIAALASRTNNKKGVMNSTKAPPATNGKAVSSSNNTSSSSNSNNAVKNNNNAVVTPNPYEVGVLVPQLRRKPTMVEENQVVEHKPDTADANCKCTVM